MLTLVPPPPMSIPVIESIDMNAGDPIAAGDISAGPPVSTPRRMLLSPPHSTRASQATAATERPAASSTAGGPPARRAPPALVPGTAGPVAKSPDTVHSMETSTIGAPQLQV